MKNNHLFAAILLTVVLSVLIFAPGLYAQGIQESIEELTGDTGQGYLQPLFNSFANNMNSGIYTSAAIPRIGLRLRINLVAMGTLIGDDDRVFTATPPLPYTQTPVKTATVFGGDGTVVEGPGVSYRFQDGHLSGDFIPFAVPQVEIGSIMGTIARVRFFAAELPGETGEELGEIKLVGYGLQHSLSQYIPLFPMSVSAGFFYQTFDIGDIMKCSTLNVGLQASKSFSVLTLFGGVNYESGKMEVAYDYQGQEGGERIEFDLDSETAFRFHVGAGLNLYLVHLNGAVYIGPQISTMVSAGIGL